VALGQFFNELKRRNVVRVAVAYLVSGWLVLQVVDVVISNIGAPQWVFSVFLLAGVVFFIPVLVFSWAYELTPEGLKRESEVDRSDSITSQTGRKLNLVTIGMLVAVVGFVILERVMFPVATEVPPAVAEVDDTEVTVTTVDDKSIAVLAFDDLSPGGDQAFFAEGLSEEILNVLAQVPGLKVAGRTSSFAFRGKDTDLREIGEILNVAHVLEGSVRKAGDRIRVTAQLIQASDGFHLFSKTYDRDLTDVFSVQDEIAALIGEALEAELQGASALPVVAETDVEAYDLYLLARQRIHSRNPVLMEEAIGMLDAALAIDADYAPALAQRGLVTHLMSDALGAYGDIPAAIANEQGLAFVDRALALDPGLAEAHAVRGLLVMVPGGVDNSEAIASLERALELNPNMDEGKTWLANASRDRDLKISLYEEVVARDPMFGPAFNNLITNYMGLGRLDDSEALIRRVARITGPDENVRQALATVELFRGDLSAASEDFNYAYEANPNSSVVQLWYAGTLYRLGEFERAMAVGIPDQALRVHAALGDLEAADRLLAEPDFATWSRFQMRDAANYLTAHGRSDEIVDIVNRSDGGLPTLLDELREDDSASTSYLGPLAYAYLQAGRVEEYRSLLAVMKAALDAQRAQGFDNQFHWWSQAQYAVLTGDLDKGAMYLERAFDSGATRVFGFEPLWDLAADDARFEAIFAKIIARGNEERAKLGLEPFRPPLGL
jgi:TolB-like protein/thioredoxin-like negative regulator of GroEL